MRQSASNAASNDWFGLAIALSSDGSTLLVGAPQEDSAATGVGGDPANNAAADAGAAYLFKRSGATWTQTTYLKASNTEAVDHFGYFVGLSADASTIAIAAPAEDSAATGVGGDQSDNSATLAGAVYIFR